MGRTGDQPLTSSDAVAAVRAALVGVGPGEVVVLAVSGGPDSVGMARLVTAARPDLRPTVVHVRHGLRDDAGDADAAAVHARALRLPVQIVEVTVAEGAGPEDAARQARLRALRDAAATAGAAYVLTGHTADDQAETMLLNIARGAGLAGLAGIPAQRALGKGVTVLHPLLGVRRQVVREEALAPGLPLASDPTNTDPEQRRARVRSDLLPALSALTGGGTDPVVTLERLARHARRDNDALDALAVATLEAGVQRWGPVLALPVAVVDDVAEAVASRVVRLLLQRVAERRYPPATAAVDDVLSLADGRLRTLPGGISVSRGGGWLAAVPADHAVLDDCAGTPPLHLPALDVTLHTAPQPTHSILPPWAPAAAATSVPVGHAARLQVRARQPGDRIRSSAGTQLIADAMIDADVPRVARELVPVISDAQGLLWVPGVAVRDAAQGPHRLSLAPAQHQ